MDERFQSWLAESKVPLDGEKLEARWVAVESVGKKLSRTLVLDLLRFFVSPSLLAVAPDPLVAAIRKADPGFVSESGNHELRSLAGIVVRLGIEHKSPPLASLAAYGLITANFGRATQPLCLPSFAKDARRQLSVLGESRRSRATKAYAAEKFSFSLPEASKAQFQPVAANLQLAFGSLNTAFAGVADDLGGLSKRLEELDAAERAQREESNILWWLMTEWSVLAEERIDAIAATDGCLLLADELARMIQILPAPLVASPVLLRLLGKTSKHGEASIVECVDSAPRHWREEISRRPSADAVQGLCPVTTAIRASLSVDEPRLWLPVFKKACSVAGEAPIRHSDLAVGFLTEVLLQKALDLLAEAGR